MVPQACPRNRNVELRASSPKVFLSNVRFLRSNGVFHGGNEAAKGRSKMPELAATVGRDIFLQLEMLAFMADGLSSHRSVNEENTPGDQNPLQIKQKVHIKPKGRIRSAQRKERTVVRVHKPAGTS